MTSQKLPEFWLRGAVENIPSLLQPVAHALLQARDEVKELMKDFPDKLLWIKPGGAASVGWGASLEMRRGRKTDYLEIPLKDSIKG